MIRLLAGCLGLVLVGLAALLMLSRREEPRPPFRVSVEYAHGGDYVILTRQDGGYSRRITAEPGKYAAPALSPNGRWVAFITSDRLARIRSSGGGVEFLTNTIDAAPVWSPDGTWLVFQSYVEENWDIYRLRLADGRRERLTTSPAQDMSPDWSPDGRWIVFISNRDGNWDIYRIAPDGSGETNLTNIDDHIFSPVWSPDSQWIGFFYNSISVRRVTHRMRPDGTEWEVLWRDDLAPVWEAGRLPRVDYPWRAGFLLLPGFGAVGAALLRYNRHRKLSEGQS